MPKSSGSGEELVNHYGLVRLRIAGGGHLRMRLLSLDEVRQRVMVPLFMVDPANIEPTRLVNFTEQRSQLEIKTTQIDEQFHCSKIIIFAKQTATSYPGN
jgi:hypothetical protein